MSRNNFSPRSVLNKALISGVLLAGAGLLANQAVEAEPSPRTPGIFIEERGIDSDLAAAAAGTLVVSLTLFESARRDIYRLIGANAANSQNQTA